MVSYASRQAALEMLSDTCKHVSGLSLLQGPSLSGKTTLIQSFVESMPEDDSIAVIDGKGLNTTQLLISVLRQFGYNLEISSANELLGLVRVFLLQQAVSHKAPLLIIENAHELNPSALRTLCELAELRVRTGSAVKIVLVSDRALRTMMAARAMAPIAGRVVHDFHLRPMNRAETKAYLHNKLRAAGSEYPEFVFPDVICVDIWRASGGWPGITDRVALLALAGSGNLPVSLHAIEHPSLPVGTWDETVQSDIEPDKLVPSAPPRFIVTNNGSVMSDVSMLKKRLLLGRSVHNDIAINSRFISRHHALLVHHGSTTFLMDLNSSNGTFVNSVRVSNRVLAHDDVITIGHHKIKFYDPCATPGDANSAEFDDTIIMKTLQDMRNLLARENTALMPVASEDLPTIQT